MPRLYIEAQVHPKAKANDAAQMLMAEFDRVAAESNRVIDGQVEIFEYQTAFGRTIRLEGDTKPR